MPPRPCCGRIPPDSPKIEPSNPPVIEATVHEIVDAVTSGGSPSTTPHPSSPLLPPLGPDTPRLDGFRAILSRLRKSPALAIAAATAAMITLGGVSAGVVALGGFSATDHQHQTGIYVDEDSADHGYSVPGDDETVQEIVTSAPSSPTVAPVEIFGVSTPVFTTIAPVPTGTPSVAVVPPATVSPPEVIPVSVGTVPAPGTPDVSSTLPPVASTTIAPQTGTPDVSSTLPPVASTTTAPQASPVSSTSSVSGPSAPIQPVAPVPVELNVTNTTDSASPEAQPVQSNGSTDESAVKPEGRTNADGEPVAPAATSRTTTSTSATTRTSTSATTSTTSNPTTSPTTTRTSSTTTALTTTKSSSVSAATKTTTAPTTSVSTTSTTAQTTTTEPTTTTLTTTEPTTTAHEPSKGAESSAHKHDFPDSSEDQNGNVLDEILINDVGGTDEIDNSRKSDDGVKDEWISTVVEEVEEEAAEEGNEMTKEDKVEEYSWIKHLLAEVQTEVFAGTNLSLSELKEEVKWIRFVSKQIAAHGLTKAGQFWQKVDPRNVAKTMSCSRKDMSYEPLDMANHHMTKELTVAACQARCQSIPECAHFSYWEPAGHCHLHDAFAKPQRSRLLFVSGPVGCRLSESTPQTMTIIRKKLTRCYEPNTATVSYDPKPFKTHSIERCQKLCRMRFGCKQFSYWLLGGNCYLSKSKSRDRVSVAGFVTGPPKCKLFPHMPIAAKIGQLQKQYIDIPGLKPVAPVGRIPGLKDLTKFAYLLGGSLFIAFFLAFVHARVSARRRRAPVVEYVRRPLHEW